MIEFRQFVIDSHQFFWGLVALGFVILWFQDAPAFREKISQKQRQLFVGLLIVFGLSIFGFFFQAWGLAGIFFSIEFAVLVTLSLIHPKFAVGFLLMLLMSRPWESFNDQLMSSMPRDASILALLVIAGHKAIKRQWYLRFNGGTFLLLAFSVWMFMSGFFSNHVDVAMVQYSEVFIKGVILFILIQNALETEGDLLPIKLVFVIAIVEKCFVSFYKTLTISASSLDDMSAQRLESVGILSNSNDIAAIFVLAIPFVILAMWKTNLKPYNWLMAALMLVIMSFLVWKSQSRGALLGLFAIFGAWGMVQVKSKKVLALMIVGGLVCTLGAFKLMNRDASDIEGSTSNRILYWRAGVNMAVRNPIFGVGFWGFPKNLPAYVPDGNTGSESEHMTAHSSWVLALAEGGPVALVLLLGLWIYSALSAWSIRENEPEYFLAILGYGVAISFLSHTYLLYPYILLSISITHAKAAQAARAKIC